MEGALDTLRGLAAKGGDERQKVIQALQRLAFSLENPQDTIHRYGQMTLQAAIIQVGLDLGVFDYVAESDTSVVAQEIPGAEEQLMIRILRFLASMGAVDEVEKGQYTANHVTRNLTKGVVKAGLSHYFGTVAPQYQRVPNMLKESGYASPVNEMRTAFHLGHCTTTDPYNWFTNNPEHLAYFNDYMALRRKSDSTWLSVYPVATEATADWPADRGLFVNIGGGVGHQCAQFKDKFPSLPGRVLLQDLPHSVAKALPTPGVENMAHDMFEPQPIVVLLPPRCCAQPPPHKVRQLLENIKAAMTPESVLLIDEMVLPERGVGFAAACIDMTMLTTFAGMERTEAQWRQTLSEVGLNLMSIHTYFASNYESVMDVRRPYSTLRA
ncbi:S-adenosyl-L-methionine-dependent methyltransferase [Apiospora arundinis]